MITGLVSGESSGEPSQRASAWYTSGIMKMCGTGNFYHFRVYVKDSVIPGAGEGLFAAVDAPADQVMSFYNGIKISHQQVHVVTGVSFMSCAISIIPTYSNQKQYTHIKLLCQWASVIF